MSELKPCPCCGGAAEYQSKYDGCQGWMVRCSRCHLEVWRGTDPGLCVELWNRRTPGPAAARLLVAAKESRSLLVRGNHPAAIQVAREVLDAAIAEAEGRG